MRHDELIKVLNQSGLADAAMSQAVAIVRERRDELLEHLERESPEWTKELAGIIEGLENAEMARLSHQRAIGRALGGLDAIETLDRAIKEVLGD